MQHCSRSPHALFVPCICGFPSDDYMPNCLRQRIKSGMQVLSTTSGDHRDYHHQGRHLRHKPMRCWQTKPIKQLCAGHLRIVVQSDIQVQVTIMMHCNMLSILLFVVTQDAPCALCSAECAYMKTLCLTAQTLSCPECICNQHRACGCY